MTTIAAIANLAGSVMGIPVAIVPSAAAAPPAARTAAQTAAQTAAANAPERARLHQAAQSFEAIFVREMLSTARQTTFGDKLWGDDQGQDTFTGMRDERFADMTARTGALGLAHQIELQLSAAAGLTGAAGAGKTTP